MYELKQLVTLNINKHLKYRNMNTIIKLLWEEICVYAKKVGRTSTKPVLLLYYVMRSPDTPMSEKLMVASAIAYVVLPVDILSARRIPVIGWLDEVVSLTVAYQKVCRYITPEMEKKVDEVLDKLFPEYACIL